MPEQELIEQIVQEVLVELSAKRTAQTAGGTANPAGERKESKEQVPQISSDNEANELSDLCAPENKAIPLVSDPLDYDALVRMKSRTSARIGVGRSGPRLNTKTLLVLRADHAAARDAVFFDVEQPILDSLHLFTVQTKCRDKDEFLTRPDLGRDFTDATLQELRSKCQMHPDVQILASDGLSSTAVNANIANILPVLQDGLMAKHISVGTPFFVKYGRVGAQEHIAEALGARVVCTLIGERPGLATAESMSAYIAYEAKVGMAEAGRTVVSNIHKDGIPAVEAGAYLVDLIQTILQAQASGVNLKK